MSEKTLNLKPETTAGAKNPRHIFSLDKGDHNGYGNGCYEEISWRDAMKGYYKGYSEGMLQFILIMKGSRGVT